MAGAALGGIYGLQSGLPDVLQLQTSGGIFFSSSEVSSYHFPKSPVLGQTLELRELALTKKHQAQHCAGERKRAELARFSLSRARVTMRLKSVKAQGGQSLHHH